MEFAPISVVIPAHNESKYLPRTIAQLNESIQKAGVEAEIIVVDDDSTDDTAVIAQELGCTVVKVALRNIGAVRNAGAAHCQTPWLFFLDADTILPARTLAAALDLLAGDSVGGGAMVAIDPLGKVTATKWLLFYTLKVVWQCIGGWAAGCFMFCERSVFEDFGGFDEAFFAAEELFFSRSVAKYGEFRVLREPVVTSARKLESYSTLELLRFVTLPILRPKLFLKTKLGLELLYDDVKSR